VRSYEPARTGFAPPGAPRPAAPHPEQRWRAVRVDHEAGAIARPPGLRLDLGGSGKGHVADLLAARLASHSEWVVDCGGDIRVGGVREVDIAHPLRAGAATRAVVRDGAVATSSVVARTWTMADGRAAHHLLDPSTGRPAWTGLLTASAFAPTTLEAETLAKVALAARGRRMGESCLSRHGGVLVHADGDVETIA